MYFLSENNVLSHKEFLKELKLKLSVLEKSYSRLSGVKISELDSLRLSAEVRREALTLKSEILLHELYFDSFSEKFYSCEAARLAFGSEASFLYEMEEAAKAQSVGFLLIYIDSKGRLSFSIGEDLSRILARATPLLALDLWEHAYFTDYGFDRKKYLKAALLHLNLNKINEFYKIY